MKLTADYSLKKYNTFGIDVTASLFATVFSTDDLQYAYANKLFTQKHLLLGGGSNILFTKNFDGIVLKNATQGIRVLEETDESVLLQVASGELWHRVVLYCVTNGWGGIENLSLIPGTAGAAPIQNIGAYGVELEQVLASVEVFDLSSGVSKILSADACKFGYRDSIFKHEAKGKYFIQSIHLRLHKNAKPNVGYGALQQVLSEKNITHPGIQDISEAVIQIRKSKLPDPALLGNAGSFFKNPEITKTAFETLRKEFPSAPGYNMLETGNVKVPAGWLIEQCGWKGRRIGNTGAHKDQALVLVNYGGATGAEILALALQIQDSVKQTFGIEIVPEVNII